MIDKSHGQPWDLCVLVEGYFGGIFWRDIRMRFRGSPKTHIGWAGHAIVKKIAFIRYIYMMENIIPICLALTVTVSALAHITAFAVMCHRQQYNGLLAVISVSMVLTLGEFIYIWKYMA